MDLHSPDVVLKLTLSEHVFRVGLEFLSLVCDMLDASCCMYQGLAELSVRLFDLDSWLHCKIVYMYSGGYRLSLNASRIQQVC